eukprot:g3661.t1
MNTSVQISAARDEACSVASHPETTTLDLEDVRRLARDADLEEIYFNEASKVISFTPFFAGGADGLKRMNVYYTTGTVGTCVEHPWQGHTQLFRPAVTLDLLAQLMLNPRLHTKFGYQRKRRRDDAHCSSSYTDSQQAKRTKTLTADVEVLGERTLHESLVNRAQKQGIIDLSSSEFDSLDGSSLPLVNDQDPLDEESELLGQSKKLEKAMAEVNALLAACRHRRAEEARRKEEEAERKKEEERRNSEKARKAQALAELKKKRTDRGTSWDYCLYHELDEIVDCDTCVSVATTGRDTVFLHEDGRMVWKRLRSTRNGLFNLLSGRKGNKKLALPIYVSMGSFNRFYVRFADGRAKFSGPKEMNIRLKKATSSPSSVTFGRDMKSFAILYENGTYTCENVPLKVSNILRSNRNKTLLAIALGPDGEFFIRMSHRSWHSGSSKFLDAMVPSSRHVKFVDFGENGSFIIRYSETECTR